VLSITHAVQTGITSDSVIVSIGKIWTQFLLHQMSNCTKHFKTHGGEYPVSLGRRGNQPNDLVGLVSFWGVYDTVVELHHD